MPSTSGGTWKLTEVYTGEVLVELPQSTPADIEAAYAAAREAQVEWAKRPLSKRLKVFKKAHTLLIDNAHITADLIQAESGKNRRMAIEETCDPPMVISHYLKRAPKLLGVDQARRSGARGCPRRPRSARPRASSGSSRRGTSRSRPASPTRSRR